MPSPAARERRRSRPGSTAPDALLRPVWRNGLTETDFDVDDRPEPKPEPAGPDPCPFRRGDRVRVCLCPGYTGRTGKVARVLLMPEYAARPGTYSLAVALDDSGAHIEVTHLCVAPLHAPAAERRAA